MTHLDSDELIDAMEGLLPADRQAHLATCAQCQRELAELSSVAAEAKQVSVPEPSPLFWQHFSQRVRSSIDEAAPPAGNWRSWLRWQVLWPAGVTALIILALMSAVPKQDAGLIDVAMVEAAPADEDGWMLVADLVGNLSLETAAEAGVLMTPGLAERAVLELTADEQQELTRLLKAELSRAKS